MKWCYGHMSPPCLVRLKLPVMRLAIACALGMCSSALHAQGATDVSPSTGTVCLLQADASTGSLKDTTGRLAPAVTGGTFMDDPAWGPCLRFGGDDRNGITLKDDGKLNFEGGVRIDAWVHFEEPPPQKGTAFAMKVGSFFWDIAKEKLNTAWMVFPSEPVLTLTPQQFKYYPVGGDMINGLMNVPLKKWVRLTVAYDEALGVVSTSIDGMTDRLRYRYRGPQRLQCDGKSPITLLQGFKNFRLGALRINTGRPQTGAPPMEVYANALPYKDQVMLTIDHIDPSLPLPVEFVVIWEKASGSADTVSTFSLKSHTRTDVFIDAPTWKNSLHTIMVNATAAGQAVLSRNFRVANVKPAGGTMIHADHTLSKDGKPFFPLLMYHAVPEEFPMLKELGFNIVFNDFNLNREVPNNPAEYSALLNRSLDAAQKSGLHFITATNSTFNKLYTIPVAKAHPAMLLWYGADEPWGDLTRLAESYNTIKMLEPNLPVLIVQNNYSRLQDTAPGADILATDPYPVPNVSLRAVVDATESCIKAVSGQKPVWTIIPQYLTKVPTREELRCMAWLAVASGANGLGFFDWDERTKDPKTGELKGWHTKEHPEQVEDLRVVLGELRAFEHVLLMPKAASQPVFTPRNLALHAMVKESGSRRFLIIANDSRYPEEGVLAFSGIMNGIAKSVGPWEARSSLEIRNGKVQVKIPALGVAMFELPLL